MYPTKETTHAKSKAKQGIIDVLTPFIAAGCNPKSNYVTVIGKSYNKGGVWWS